MTLCEELLLIDPRAHRLSRLKKQPGSEPKRRVTDEELRCIIEDLERSTEAIRKHQTVLEKQKAALQKFRNNESEDTSSTRQEASHGTLRTNAQASEGPSAV